MVTFVQPIFESLAVFAWCVMLAVVPAAKDNTPAREDVAADAMEEIFDDMAMGVMGNNPDKYLKPFSSAMRDKFRGDVTAALNGPKRHCLVMKYKAEPVNVSSYEATYRVKILTQGLCNTGYESNIEHATITIGVTGDSSDNVNKPFLSTDSAPPDQWQITDWNTEAVIPFDVRKHGNEWRAIDRGVRRK